MSAAKEILKSNPEWAYNISYNAMHQAGRAFLFRKGYRTVGIGHHATVIRFLEIGLGPEHEEILAVMDRMRRKRNRATYDRVGTISQKEAKEGISSASELVKVISIKIKYQRK